MKHKLIGKFSIAYLSFLLVSLLLVLWVVPGRIDDYLIKEKAAKLQLAAEGLAKNPSISNCVYSRTDNTDSVKSLLETLTQYQQTEVWLVNESGRVLLSSRLDYPITQSLEIPDFSPQLHDQPYWVVGDFFGMFRQNTLSIVAPVTAPSRTTGFVMIHYPIFHLKPNAQRLINIVHLILLIFLSASLLLPLAFYLLFYRPFLSNLHLSDAYASGNLTVPAPTPARDEFGLLQNNLNYMAEELRRSGEYQRNFVSNVSHDFRSPLTSIKGYAEAILDGTVPRESQDKYLTIILAETERLSHLTQNILTFNNLNDNGTRLDLSVFDINQVIQAIVTSMEIQSRKKDLQILLTLSASPLKVNADKEKIMQVIYNLLDNAIKFSRPHSSIQITTARKMKYVFVSIKDNGEGIPADQIPKIWNRFYKSDTSRGRDKRGTGLGLSIVREIIRAHGQNINVVSTVGVGSEFIFTLDKG